MKFKKHIEPAHRDYFLTLVRHNGERVQWYTSSVYHTKAPAQKAADHRNTYYTHGQLIVEFVDRAEGPVWTGTTNLY